MTLVGGGATSFIFGVLHFRHRAPSDTADEILLNPLLGIGVGLVAWGFVAWGLLQLTELQLRSQIGFGNVLPAAGPNSEASYVPIVSRRIERAPQRTNDHAIRDIETLCWADLAAKATTKEAVSCP